MELSRRDALAALGVAGVAAGGVVTVDQLGEDPPLGSEDVETLVALARVVYPSELTGVAEFVETHAAARADARPEHARAMADAVADLQEAARDWHGAPFLELDPGTRETLLVELGCDTADPDPEGTTAERLRYFLVNELLYALYTSPTGAELVGLENPQGHPGGIGSYQRGPDR